MTVNTTLPPFKLQQSDFSNEALLSELPLGAHDAVIVGDTLTSLTINSEWRKFISHSIGFYLEYGLRHASQSQLDVIDPLIGNLFDDFYSADPGGGGDLMVSHISARRSTAQAIPPNADTPVVWDTGDYDVSNPSRLVVPENALVWIVLHARMESTNTTVRRFELWKNGAYHKRIQVITSATLEQRDLVEIDECVAGDYFELIVRSGQASNVVVDGEAPSMKIFYVING